MFQTSYYNEPEGTGFEHLDKRFGKLLIGHARVERLWTGARWAEGPAWFAAGRYLVFSDIPNNRMMRFDETDSSMSVFRHPSNNSNGNTTDREGRLVTCEHLGRRVSRTEHDGSITVLADRYKGKRFNSPNDVIVKSDGSIWFTDPTYGIDADYEGARAESEIGASNVYRIDPSGEITIVADDFVKPNGLAFSPDEKTLYVADTGCTHVENGPKHIRALAVKPDGKSLGASKMFADCNAGLFDGFRVDKDGRIWTSAGDGVHCFLPNGDLIGKIRIPELVANVCFGGAQRNRLFICGCTSLYSAYLAING
ncbi:SMP-30/gluconolactonase/LRE family protein [Aestuariivirga sp.]|uniref:SMP-30/gluconolactonase/LRE family protein n=1 Tax=Aestuariivirga sp. TaxID=2650926 RepID=UPI0039E6A339